MLRRHLTLALLATSLTVTFAWSEEPAPPIAAGERLPPHVVTEKMRELGRQAAILYREQRQDGDIGAEVPFVPGGIYLYYSKWQDGFKESEVLKLDAEELPMQILRGSTFYNPAQLGNYALRQYDFVVSAGRSDVQFMRAARKLRALQRADGAFTNNGAWKHYTQAYNYRDGWVDGMSPGLVLSVYARAYEHTGDRDWIDAGNKVLEFMQVPFPEGPMSTLEDLDPSLKNYTYYQEYPTNPQNYTLNGFLFAVLGLYEWWKIADSEEARIAFEKAMRTLEVTLPYYDIGTFSAYDLAYITYSRQWYLQPQEPHPIPVYHAIHLYQLKALYSVTNSPILKKYIDLWDSYVK